MHWIQNWLWHKIQTLFHHHIRISRMPEFALPDIATQTGFAMRLFYSVTAVSINNTYVYISIFHAQIENITIACRRTPGVVFKQSFL